MGMNVRIAALAIALSAALALSGCSGGGKSAHTESMPPASGGGSTPGGSPDPGGDPSPGDNTGSGGAPVRGPRVGSSDLSPILGAEADFGPEVAEALARAARAVPNGASQSSSVENGRTADEMSVRVVRDDDGNLSYEVTDGARIMARAPGPPNQDFRLALFTDMLPGIEPDLSSYPHDLLGVWATAEEAGAFWSRSPEAPAAAFDAASQIGAATYEGDAVGLRVSGGAAAKFVADVEMVADFSARTVSGRVEKFRSFAGEAFEGLSVKLGETGFSPQGAPFEGETTASGAGGDIAGGGKWGARWSDGKGWTMGGTFGFAATDGSVSLLGAFSAVSGATAAPGNPDDPVTSGSP